MIMGAPGGPKTGGRQKGTPNRSTSARYAAMEKVNAALNQLGEDSLSGMRLLQEVIKSKDCPLDIRIQCSGLLLKHEMELAPARQQYVAERVRHERNSWRFGGRSTATCPRVMIRNGTVP